MSDQRPPPNLTQIAASIEDVEALLRDNRSLSVAFLSRRLQDVEKDMREGFRALKLDQDQRLATLEGDVKKLQERLQMARVVYKEMRDELMELDKFVKSCKT